MPEELVLELKKGWRVSVEKLAAALRKTLASRHGIELAALEGDPATGVAHGRAKIWVPLDYESLGPLRGVHVPISVAVDVRLEGSRAMTSVAAPSTDDLGEAASFVAGLVARGQVARVGSTAGRRTTHRVETDAQGRRLLKRTRFSALAE